MGLTTFILSLNVVATAAPPPPPPPDDILWGDTEVLMGDETITFDD